jgi:hypothetical protein
LAVHDISQHCNFAPRRPWNDRNHFSYVTRPGEREAALRRAGRINVMILPGLFAELGLASVRLPAPAVRVAVLVCQAAALHIAGFAVYVLRALNFWRTPWLLPNTAEPAHDANS